MSARSEQLVEEINELNEKIAQRWTTSGEQPSDELTALLERQEMLLRELRVTLDQLKEGKVLKG